MVNIDIKRVATICVVSSVVMIFTMVVFNTSQAEQFIIALLVFNILMNVFHKSDIMNELDMSELEETE